MIPPQHPSTSSCSAQKTANQSNAPDSWGRQEEGQDMIEYALLAALISIVAIAIILLVGPYLINLFQDVVNALNSA
jgi:Flp pilus assembly pilin Flp